MICRIENARRTHYSALGGSGAGRALNCSSVTQQSHTTASVRAASAQPPDSFIHSLRPHAQWRNFIKHYSQYLRNKIFIDWYRGNRLHELPRIPCVC